jgi:hypothetical protein
MGLASAGVVLIGKFAMDSDWVTNGGIALLVPRYSFDANAAAVRPRARHASGGPIAGSAAGALRSISCWR